MIKKNILVYLLILLLFSCENYSILNPCFENSIAPVSLDLNNPQLNGVLTPTGYVEINAGLQGLILFNGATFGYKAFDRKCPNFDCNTPMSFDGLYLICSCDNNKYSILTGEPSAENNSNCSAREYTVTVNGTSLRISN